MYVESRKNGNKWSSLQNRDRDREEIYGHHRQRKREMDELGEVGIDLMYTIDGYV